MTPLFKRLLHSLVALAVAIAPGLTSASMTCGGTCCSGEDSCCGGCAHGKSVEKSESQVGSCCAAKKPVAVKAVPSCCAQQTIVENEQKFASAETIALVDRCDCCRPVAPSPQRSEDRSRQVRPEFELPLFLAAYNEHSSLADAAAMCGVADGFTTRPAGVALRVWLCCWTC